MIFGSRAGWIGVDIGTQAVKVAQVRRLDKGFASTAAVLLPRGDSWHGQDLQTETPRRSSDEIRAALTSNQTFGGRTAACALPMEACDYRQISLPEGDGSQQQASGERRQAWEYDAWTTHPETGPDRKAERQLHLVGTPSGWAEQVSLDHRAAGLRCRTLDAVPTALARAVQMSDLPGPAGSVAAVDWGFSRITLCVVHQGQAALVRSFRDGCVGHIVAALRRALPVSVEEARRLLSDYGVQHDRAGQEPGDDVHEVIHDCCRPAVDHLADQLQRTISFLQSYQRPLLPQIVQLFGAGATLNRVPDVLEAKVGIPTRKWQLRRPGVSGQSALHTDDPLLGIAMALSAIAWWKT